MANTLALAYGMNFADLYDREGLSRLDAAFIAVLCAQHLDLHNRLITARAEPGRLTEKDESRLIIDLAPVAEAFIAQLFGIEKDVGELVEAHLALSPLYLCKRNIVQRKAAKQFKEEEACAFDGAALGKQLESWMGEPLSELSYAKHITEWMEKEDAHREAIAVALRYAAWALYSVEGRHKHTHGVLFQLPRKIDPLHLVPVETEMRGGVTMLKLPDTHLRRREGFALTDPGGTLTQALDEANYCIWCHHQGKDSCAKGMREKEGGFKKNSLGITLSGCPLEEKISEMHEVKAHGVPLGALAVAIIDNPMLAGTGHRICNDCMKSCIYQKQEPVNIPLAETRILQDVLHLPYGFEIYSLLTRWNPLNIRRPLPLPDTGCKVLVAGLGPAGYTLSHHLMNDGHTVVGIDGLKIEPLDASISGVTALGERVLFAPIRDIGTLLEELDRRPLAGFGGVAEYGITVRWDKNYLKIIRLLLERRARFAMFGGVRFGSTITYDSAFALGFDHIALCLGAGKPTVIDMPNAMARGVRTASDFLMALQLTGAAKRDAIANLQLRLPVVVIGGGLTAIDTATESLAYYPVQVEKFLSRYEALAAEQGEQAVRAGWSEEETTIAEAFIAHAQAIRAARAAAKKDNRAPDIIGLLKSWGGVTMAYRKRLVDAPSYRLNHEEVEKALEEGICIAENVEPLGVEVDAYGHANAVRFAHNDSGKAVTLPARAVLMAAGTSPNTVLQREDPLHFTLDGKYFRAIDEAGNAVKPERVCKPSEAQVLMHLDDQGRAVSFFGDLHPSFAGNVVKAMGSAKQGYPVISRVLEKKNPERGIQRSEFFARLNDLLRPRVHAVHRLTPTIVEVVLHAPLAACEFRPGQFYRLQNYEHFARKHREPSVGSREKATFDPQPSTLATTLAMEGLALTGAWVDKAQGLLSAIVLEMGGSSDLCAHLAPGEPVVLMGPTGAPTEIPENETVMLVGGGLGNAVLFSIGKALRKKGSRVLYFAGYKKAIDRYKVEEIEAAADIVVWCCDEAAAFAPGRPQDKSFHGNMVQAIAAYAKGELGAAPIATADVQRMITIGSDRMMAAVAYARHHELKPYFSESHIAIGSINSPMQCMMKEICAQCLQKHIDPVSGAESYVYSCFNQDQLLDSVSFEHLQERLKQNGVQEKITARWVDACLKSKGLRSSAA